MPSAVEEDVLGLDVAVDDACRVERVEPRGDLGDDADELRDPERGRLRDAVAERAAGDVVDRQVVAPVRLGSLDDRDEVRVVHLGGGPRFLAEPVLEDEIAGELDLEHLQRDLAAVLGAARRKTSPIPPSPRASSSGYPPSVSPGSSSRLVPPETAMRPSIRAPGRELQVVELLVQSRHRRAPDPALRLRRVAGGTLFPTRVGRAGVLTSGSLGDSCWP